MHRGERLGKDASNSFADYPIHACAHAAIENTFVHHQLPMDTTMVRVTSIRLSDELAGRLASLAASLDRPRAWLIEQAIARYVEEEAWQLAAIAEALDEYQRGGASLLPHDEVMGRLEAKIRARAEDADTLA